MKQLFQIHLLTVVFLALFLSTDLANAAVTEVDLTATPVTSAELTSASGDLFFLSSDDVGSSGTGLIDPFLNIQAQGSEEGFNYDLPDSPPPLLDVNRSQTDSLQVSTVPTYNINGNEWGEFVLDLNEPTTTSEISLNQIQIFAATETYATSDLSGEFTIDTEGQTNFVTFNGDPLTEVQEVFRLSDSITEYELLLNTQGAGSGQFDYRFFFDADIINSLGSEFTHFIVYTQFGVGTYSSGSGFEEWAIARDDIQIIPEPSTWALLLITACGAICLQYRKQRQLKLAGESAAS